MACCVGRRNVLYDRCLIVFLKLGYGKSRSVPSIVPTSDFYPALGRAGFGASLDGLVCDLRLLLLLVYGLLQWPYSYDSCDVGTLPNQTYPGTNKPLAASENGDPQYGGVLVGSVLH